MKRSSICALSLLALSTVISPGGTVEVLRLSPTKQAKPADPVRTPAEADTHSVFYPFDAENPLLNGNPGIGGRVFAGYLARVPGVIQPTLRFSSRITGLVMTSSSDGEGTSLAEVFVFWDKMDFLNGADKKTLSFDQTSQSSFTLALERFDAKEGQLVIREGTDFFISSPLPFKAEGFVNVFTGDTSDLEWAAWNPAGDDGRGFLNPPESSYSQRVFTNVTGVGLFGRLQRDGANPIVRFQTALDDGAISVRLRALDGN